MEGIIASTTISELIDLIRVDPINAQLEVREKELDRIRGEVEELKQRLETSMTESERQCLEKQISTGERRLSKGIKCTRRPGARVLQNNGKAVAISKDGSITVYDGGYAVYRNISRCAVLWVPDAVKLNCIHFLSLSDAEKKRTKMSDYVIIESGKLPWETALVLLGEAAVNSNFYKFGWEEVEEEETDEEEERKGTRRMKCFENPEEAYIRKETIREIMAKLTPCQQEVLILSRVYGYSQMEIGERLSISQKAVSLHLQAIGKKLGEKSTRLLLRYV